MHASASGEPSRFDATPPADWHPIEDPIPFTSTHFAPVPPDEMGFALQLFVEAASRSYPDGEDPALRMEDPLCPWLYDLLCARAPVPEGQGEGPDAGKEPARSLPQAFQALCRFYRDDPHQVAICARVLAFHFLMEATTGAAIAGWTETSEGTPELVDLHPAVVEALASIELDGSLLLSAGPFGEAVMETDQRNVQAAGGRRLI